MREEEGEEQEIENLFEKIMKENFPNLKKERDIQVQEAQRVPNKLDPKGTTPRHNVSKMPKVKDKERILKVVKEFSYQMAARWEGRGGKWVKK